MIVCSCGSVVPFLIGRLINIRLANQIVIFGGAGRTRCGHAVWRIRHRFGKRRRMKMNEVKAQPLERLIAEALRYGT